VVSETEYPRFGTVSRTSLIRVPFPPPEGELIMTRLPFTLEM